MNDVRLTGRPFLAADGQVVRLPPSKRAALLYYLAYQGDWVPRDELLYLLYPPDATESVGRSALRPLLSRIRGLTHVHDLEIEPTRVRWSPSTDVGAFREAVRGGRPERAVEHYHGELLASFSLPGVPAFDTWLELERHESRRDWRRVASGLAARLTRDGRDGEAAEVLAKLAEADALDEEVLRWRLVVLARTGRPGEALDTYEAFADALSREVDGVPEPETVRLVELIRSGGLPSEDPFGAVEREARATRITGGPPVMATAFVGREEEIRDSSGRFGDREHRERDPSEREELLRRSVHLFREVEGHFGITLSLYNLSICLCWTHGRYTEAHDHVTEAVQLEPTHGLPFRLAWWRNWQGTVATYRGRMEVAEACFSEARAIGEALEPGFGRWEADRALWGLAQVAASRGHLPRAEALLLDALRGNERHPDPFASRTDFLVALAQIALNTGRIAEASDRSREAARYLRDHRQDTYAHAWLEASCSTQLGEIALAEGDPVEAERHLRDALVLARSWHLVPAILRSFLAFGRLYRSRAEEEHAALLFAHAAENPASLAEVARAARRVLLALPADLVAAATERVGAATVTEIAGGLAAGDLSRVG